MWRGLLRDRAGRGRGVLPRWGWRHRGAGGNTQRMAQVVDKIKCSTCQAEIQPGVVFAVETSPGHAIDRVSCVTCFVIERATSLCHRPRCARVLSSASMTLCVEHRTPLPPAEAA